MANGSVPYGDALASMLALLDNFVPASPAPLPAAALSVAGLSERSVGLGGLRGLEFRDSFEVGELKAIRLDALVRYDLWGDSPTTATQAVAGVGANLLNARVELGTNGVLKLNLESVEAPDFSAGLNAWRSAALYRVLYEFPYQDTDGAESLLARIPIEFDHETAGVPALAETVVTDEFARWDDVAAPPLIVAGPTAIAAFDALSWFSAQAPSGPIAITRTFDRAPGPRTVFGAFDAFLDAIAGTGATVRDAILGFATISDFLAAIGAPGAAVTLGDWDQNGVTDVYVPRTRAVLPPILLPEPIDRLEISYGDPALDRSAVVYLRATRG